MNKKRGFTLIEIIICIALIAIIGTTMTFVVINSNKNKQIKILENNNKILENALEVYLEKHEEIQTNLENSAKGAVVTLEVLKNEGLIDEKQFKGIELKKNYFFLSYSMLDNKPNTDCDNNVIPLSIVESWKVDTDKVVYICPRTDSGSGGDNGSDDENKSSIINQYGNSGYYIAKGSNPNNWVKFEVTAGNSNTDLAYFPNDEDKDLWRIVSIDENGGIKLVYNKDVKANNQLIYTNYNGNDKNYEDVTIFDTTEPSVKRLSDLRTYLELDGRIFSAYCDININKCFYPYKIDRVKRGPYRYQFKAFYKLKTSYNYTLSNERCIKGSNNKKYLDCNYGSNKSTFRYSSLNGWNIMDLYDDGIYNNDEYKENTKLYYLYNNITNKDWLDVNDAYYFYDKSGAVFDLDFSYTKRVKLFSLTKNDIDASLLIGKSWLYNFNTLSGVYRGDSYGNGSHYDTYSNVYISSGDTHAEYSILQSVTGCTTGDLNCDSYDEDYQAFELSTGQYYPVITLKSNVKLKGNKCNTKDKLGSKKCPYTLEWVDDVTDGAE